MSALDSPLLSAVGADGQDFIDLGDIAFGEPHVLRELFVRATKPLPSVHLSVHGPVVINSAAVHFQRHNESLAASGNMSPSNVNLAFTDADHVERICLLSGEPVSLILAVLPSPNPPRTVGPTTLSFSPLEGSITITISGELSNAADTASCTLPVRGRICSSLISVQDISDPRGVVFENALVGTDYVKDFSLVNNSEIQTFVRVQPPLPPHIRLLDYESGLPLIQGTAAAPGLGSVIHLQPFESKRVRVHFAPRLPSAEAEITVELENARNSANVERVRIVTSASIDVPLDDLKLSCGSEISFGDCYTGKPTARSLRVRNLSKADMEVALALEGLVDGEVRFELVSEWTDDTAINGDDDTIVEQREGSTSLSADEESESRSPWSEGTKQGLTNVQNLVEELLVRPEQERLLKLWYLPTNETTDLPDDDSRQSDNGRLRDRTFTVVFRSLSHVVKKLGCRARVCQSVVALEQAELDLGDCSIQSQRDVYALLQNYSDLPAIVCVKYKSKSVHIQQDTFTIPPRESYECAIAYVPRKVNPEYSKAITFVNLRNRDNDSVLTIRANVIDRNRVTVHPLFYRILAPTVTNEVDFGSSVETLPAIRPFRIRNVTSKPITLSFECPPGTALLELTAQRLGHSEVQSDSAMADMHLDSSEYSRTVRSDYNSDAAGPDGFGRTSEPEMSFSTAPLAAGDFKIPSSDELVARLTSRPIPPSYLGSDSERRIVEERLRPVTELHAAARRGWISRCEFLTIPADQETTVLATFTPISGQMYPTIREKAKTVEATVLVRLENFDCALLNQQRPALHGRTVDPDAVLHNDEIPPRELTFVVNVCRSQMHIDQQVWNFGTVFIGERHEKVLIVHNASEANLLYVIKKTGNMASGDVVFSREQAVGVLRPFASREIPFVFAPSMVGSYMESVVVSNLEDVRDTHTLKIKAAVYRKDHFRVDRDGVGDFGCVVVGQRSSHALKLSLHNISYKARRFTIEIRGNGQHGAGNSAALVDGLISVDRRRENALLESTRDVDAIHSSNGRGTQAFVSGERDTLETREFLNTMSCSVKAGGSLNIRIVVIPRVIGIGHKKTAHFLVACFESKNSDYVENIKCVADIENRVSGSSSFELMLPSAGLQTRDRTERLKQKEFLRVDQHLYDLGHIQVGQTQSCALTVTSASEEDIRFAFTTNDEVRVAPAMGVISARTSVEVILHITPRRVGTLRLNSSLSAHPVGQAENKVAVDVSISASVSETAILRILQADRSGTLDLGLGCIERPGRPAIVHRLDIENLSSRQVIISPSSNLPSQISVMNGGSAGGGPNSVQAIDARGSACMSVCVSPRLPRGLLETGVCPEITAGLHLNIMDNTTRSHVSKMSFRVKFVIGISLLVATPEKIDLGRLRSGHEGKRGSFRLVNNSRAVDAEYRLSSSSERLRLASTGGVLVSRKVGASDTEESFSVACNQSGFFSETIFVANQRTPSQSRSVKVVWFVDPGFIEYIDLPLSGGWECLPKVTVFLSWSSESEVAVASAPETTITMALLRRNLAKLHVFPLTGGDAPVHVTVSRELTVKSDCVLDVPHMDRCGESFLWNETRSTSFAVQGNLPNTPFTDPEQSGLLRGNLVARSGYFGVACVLPGNQRITPSEVQKVIKTSVEYCVSRLRVVYSSPLDSSTEVGEFGYRSQWNPIQAFGTVRNASDLPLEFCFGKLPTGVCAVNPASSEIIPARGAKSVCVEIDPTLLGDASGSISLEIPILNLNNAHDGDVWCVHGTLTSARLEFERLRSLPDRSLELIIPSLELPCLETDSKSEWFRVRNNSNTSLRIESEFQSQSSRFGSLFELSLTELSSGSLVRSGTMGPGETLSLRVQVSPGSLASSPQHIDLAFQDYEVIQAVQTSGAINIGSMRFQSTTAEGDDPPHIIKLCTVPKRGPAVTTSTKTLSFASTNASVDDLEEYVDVHNHWSTCPFLYCAEIVDLPDGVLADVFPRTGSLPPRSSRRLTVSMRRDPSVVSRVAFRASLLLRGGEDTSEKSEPIAVIALKVNLRDKDTDVDSDESHSISAGPRSVPRSGAEYQSEDPVRGISRISSPSPSLPDASASSQDDAVRGGGPLQAASRSLTSNSTSHGRAPARENLPQLVVRGCKSLDASGTRYEIDVGQVTASSPAQERSFVVESPLGSLPLVYTIHRMSGDAGVAKHSWFSMNRNGGALDDRRKSNTISIRFATQRVGIFAAYLIVENHLDPNDVKIVRLTMEVVSDCASNYFSVTCEGSTAAVQTMELPIVMLNNVYRHFSFVIFNHADVALDFLLAHDLDPAANSELNFSLTNVTLRRVSTVTVPPAGSTRVFLYYRPMLEDREASRLQAGNESIDEVYLPRSMRIFVTCRLVKDYQEIVHVKSTCRPAQLRISSQDFVFSLHDSSQHTQLSEPGHPGSANTGEKHPDERDVNQSQLVEGSPWEPFSQPELGLLHIRNMYPRELDYRVRGECTFFRVDVPESCVVGPNGECFLKIRPDPEMLRKMWQHVKLERYIEEHVTVYNRRFPRESFWVRLRLHVGGTLDFSGVVDRRGVEFSGLEQTVAHFVRRFGVFWSRFRHPRPCSPDEENDEGSRRSQGVSTPHTPKGKVAGGRLDNTESRTSVGVGCLETAQSDPEYKDLLLGMHHATDELVYYALKDPSDSVMQLAQMLYGFILTHKIFESFLPEHSEAHEVHPEGPPPMPKFLGTWAGQLRHFLSYFPDKTDRFGDLCVRAEQLRRACEVQTRIVENR